MIKKWNMFIKEEFINKSEDDYIDAKMQEIKDLVDNTSNGLNILYEWENKNDHELMINFTIGDKSIKYEYDIDDLILTKVVNNKIEFSNNLESVEEGLEIIEKDIQSILGISESLKNLKLFEEFKKEYIHSMEVKDDGHVRIKWTEDVKELNKLKSNLEELLNFRKVHNRSCRCRICYGLSTGEKGRYFLRIDNKIKIMEDRIKKLEDKMNESKNINK